MALAIEPRWIEPAARASAQIAGVDAPLDRAVAQAVELLRSATAPALVGLNGLSIDGVRAAAQIARKSAGKWLPWPSGSPEPATRLVTQTMSLGHALASDLIVWVGCSGTDSAITRAIISDQLLSAFLGPELSVVLNLRRLLANTKEQSPFGSAKKIAVVVGANVDSRVVSQWHKLANESQKRHRIGVLQLPAAHAENSRGGFEAITWLAGVSPTRGGIDFANHPPIGCADAATQLSANAIDVALDFVSPNTRLPWPADVKRIFMGERHDPAAAVSFQVPALALGVDASVMRFDGVTLRLSSDAETAVPDHAANILREMAQQL